MGGVPKLQRMRVKGYGEFRIRIGMPRAGARGASLARARRNVQGAHVTHASQKEVGMARTVADVLVERLIDWKVDTIFALAGRRYQRHL